MNTETPGDRRSEGIGLAGERQGFAGRGGFVGDATVPTRALKHGQAVRVVG